MRSSTDASSPPWPMRIFRPWLVASATGLLIGILLLAVTPEPQSEVNSYAESAPRAAVYDPRGETLTTDPFAPAPSLAAPPDEPRPAAEGAVSVQVLPSATREAGTP